MFHIYINVKIINTNKLFNNNKFHEIKIVYLDISKKKKRKHIMRITLGTALGHEKNLHHTKSHN